MPSGTDSRQAASNDPPCPWCLPTSATALRVLSLILCLSGWPPAAASAQWGLGVTDSARLAAPRLTESSGVVASSASGVFWSHNDSGDGPVLYATDAAGHDLGSIRVERAHARDWEDIAAGPCFVAPGRCLYVADIGDNGARRPRVVIYRVQEPVPPSGPADTLRSVPVFDSIVLRYPDRPHDAEALAVTATGTILLVTKDLGRPATLFRARANGPATQRLERVRSLPIRINAVTGRLVTGADVAPGDSLLAVRTYVSLHLFRLRGDTVLTPLGDPDGVTLPFVEAQGEGIAFDGPDHLVLVSEKGASECGTIARLRLTLRR